MVNLSRYEERPNDPAAILEASNLLASAGNNDAAMLFIENGLAMKPSDEIKAKLLEQASISGFYSKLPERRRLGKDACESLATDRKQSWQTKNLARQNSTYYARSSTDIMPGTLLSQVNFVPPDDYKPMNPSITNKGNELWMIQRTVNYVIRPDGSYDMRGDSAIRTRNYIMRLADDLSVLSSEEIMPPLDMPEPLYNLVIGFEDCRLFFWKGEFWCTSTVRELNQEGYCEIVLSRIARDQNGVLRYHDHRVIRPTFCDRQHEKNWMPMVVGDSLFFLYSSDPARIIDADGNIVSNKVTHFAADSFRGGGPLLEFNGGWLACIHESHGMPDWRRRYMHRFAWYDSFGRLARYSEAFYINKLGIEFAAGLAKQPGTDKIVVSFGLDDKQSWLATFDPNEIKKMLKPAGPAIEYLEDAASGAWVISETNKALKNHDIVERVKAIATKSCMPLHIDGPKNWDNMVAIWQAATTTDRTMPVMDVAATPESAFLPGLKKLGYDTLISINIDEKNPRIVDGISYQVGDCTSTEFADGYFGFISCLSVVEHGVDIQRFMAESSRILAVGGHLLVSTDYWQDPIDTFGQTAFGSPVKVFTATDIVDMIRTAQEYGLEITSNVDLACDQQVVNWIGMDYTFINLLFRKIS